MFRVVLAALFVSFAVPAAAAQSIIGSACLKSERGRGKPRLCGCIQQVANGHLNRSDQRKVAGFFTDPERAQRVRLSDSRNDEKFWERYEVFGAAAEALCRRRY